MNLLNGKEISETIKNEIRTKVLDIKASGKRAPHLAAIQVGTNPASTSYVTSKVKDCEEVGFTSTLLHFDDNISQEFLLNEIEKLNQNPEIDGFIVQLPLPKHIDEVLVTNSIKAEKDVDGFHPINLGKMVLGLPTFISATPYGIIELLKRYNIPTAGKNVVVLGRSSIVGTPVSILLSRNNAGGNATVTLCHSKTQNLKEFTLKADIIIAALGIPEFLKADMIKQDAIVVDVGISRVEDKSKKSGFKLVGDVDFEEVSKKSSWITPVPGGVGPMTRVALLQNTLLAYNS